MESPRRRADSLGVALLTHLPTHLGAGPWLVGTSCALSYSLNSSSRAAAFSVGNCSQNPLWAMRDPQTPGPSTNPPTYPPPPPAWATCLFLLSLTSSSGKNRRKGAATQAGQADLIGGAEQGRI